MVIFTQIKLGCRGRFYPIKTRLRLRLQETLSPKKKHTTLIINNRQKIMKKSSKIIKIYHKNHKKSSKIIKNHQKKSKKKNNKKIIKNRRRLSKKSPRNHTSYANSSPRSPVGYIATPKVIFHLASSSYTRGISIYEFLLPRNTTDPPFCPSIPSPYLMLNS